MCFDWVSADIRVAGYLSGDQFINNSFKESDPYIEIEKLLGANDITRDDCKLEVLKSIYSVNIENPLFDIMSQLKAWIANKQLEYESGMAVKTILGMPIPREDIKSSLSGIIQGSVAEAIQNTLIKITETIGPECILAEVHDSLVVACSEKKIKDTIGAIIPLVTRPLNIDLTFPVKVSIGRQWKQWKPYKIYR